MADERIRYNKIVKLLKPIVGVEIPLHKLRHRVMIDIGSSELVIRETINLMLEFGLIQEVSDRVYKIIRSEAEV